MRLGLATAESIYAGFCAYLRGSMLREELEDRIYQSVGIVQLPASEPFANQSPMPFLNFDKETGA
jgi:hypothetical protein